MLSSNSLLTSFTISLVALTAWAHPHAIEKRQNISSSGYSVNPTPPTLTFLYEMFAETAPPISILNTPSSGAQGGRFIYPIVGGSVAGPNMTGTVLNLGADWGSSNSVESFYPDTRYNFVMGDGSNVYIRTKGAYQFDGVGHLSAHFEASLNGSYAWLNNVVGYGIIEAVTAPSILNTTLATPKTKGNDVLRIRMWRYVPGSLPTPAP